MIAPATCSSHRKRRQVEGGVAHWRSWCRVPAARTHDAVALPVPMSSRSFLWYDLETFGIDPRRSRVAQFAAQRTDEALNPVEPPVMLYCQPAFDLLPSPAASMVTGLTPQAMRERGLPEARCFAHIDALMREPGTCSAGWNTLRFDDEFIRCGLYRNFFDPYAREWSNGNSRWDLLDHARLAHALRPEGIVWPARDDGFTSFRLEHLAAANGVVHGAAHDALSDVEATIGMARLFRAAQPRLWQYHLDLREKKRVRALLDPIHPEPLLHVSGRFPASRGCAGIVLPLAEHPAGNNQVIVFELHDDPARLFDLAAEDLAELMYTPQSALPDGVRRVALKAIHLARSPALVKLRHVSDAELARLGLDRDRCLAHAEQLRRGPPVAERVRQVFARGFAAGADADQALYDALPDRRDQRTHAEIRASHPADLRRFSGRLLDPRGDELLLRYRARNWPETLDAGEAARWREYREARLAFDSGLSEYSFDSFFAEIAALSAQHGHEPRVAGLLADLADWGRLLARYP
jgi:exodeoxyribonuclease I